MTENQLEAWVVALSERLGVDVTGVDTQGLLDLAGDAAHSVMRPAAPLSTFLVGYAAGLKGTGLVGIGAATAEASALALSWPKATT